MKRIALFLVCAAVALAQSAGVGSVWTTVTGTLQNAATGNGNGSTLAVQGLASVAMTVNCSVACAGGTTITFQGSQDGTNFVALNGMQPAATTTASTVVNQGTTPTVWFVPVPGLQLIRAAISSYSAGTITVTATGVAAAPGPANVAVVNTPSVAQSGTWSVTAGGTFPVSWTSQSVSLTGSWPYSGTLGAVTQSGGPWTFNLTQVGGSSVF